MSESNGCFNVIGRVKRGDDTFVLTVSARGFAPAGVTFRKGDPLTALVRLESAGASTITLIPESRLTALYDEPCVPRAVPGAATIGLR